MEDGHLIIEPMEIQLNSGLFGIFDWHGSD